MELIAQSVQAISKFVWGPYMLMLLVGTGIFLTLRLRLITIRKFFVALKLVLAKQQSSGAQGDITPFQALTTALAATIGTGNIAGVATAIYLGGPGAIFWMWVCALFGMATKFSEVLLAVKYRRHLEDGTISGGPMLYLSQGLGLKWLGILFALFGSFAALGTGNMVQSNSVSLALYEAFGIPSITTGVVLSILTALVIIGGIKRIGSVTEKVVPFMALFYLGCGSMILFTNISRIPYVFNLIFGYAFAPCAPSGGFMGATVALALRYGIARGVFSNEAGLGSAPIAHAAAKTSSPVQQGLISVVEVFLDTIVICSMTACIILLAPEIWQSGLNSSALTTLAFETFLPGVGKYIIAIGLSIFAYSTLIGWSYYGEECVEFLFGIRARAFYRWIFCGLIILGATIKVTLVWDVTDAMNGAMIVPNLIGLLGLSSVTCRETSKYFKNRL